MLNFDIKHNNLYHDYNKWGYLKMNNKSIFNKASILSVAILLTIACDNKEIAHTDGEDNKLINNKETANQLIHKPTEPSIIQHTQASAKVSINPPPLAIFFGPSEDEIPKEAHKQIKDIAHYLIETGDTFEIEGCSSIDGQTDNNFFLAMRRANGVLNALEEQGVPVTRYQNINGITGQDRDVYGTGEGECTSLTDETQDTKENSRRVNIHLNPHYKQEEPQSTNQVDIFDLFKSWLKDEPEPEI